MNQYSDEEIRQEIEALKSELGYSTLSGEDNPNENPNEEQRHEENEEKLVIPQVKLIFERPHVDAMVYIDRSVQAANYFRLYFDQGTIDLQERFIVFFLNRKNLVLGHLILAQGGLTSVTVDIRLILAAALKCLCTGIMLCHNHPSGNLKPSYGDIRITRNLQEAAKYHDIEVLDHIILTSEGYFSMADEGIIYLSNHV